MQLLQILQVTQGINQHQGVPCNYQVIFKLRRVQFSIRIQSIKLNSATTTFHTVGYEFIETARIKILGIRGEITIDKKKLLLLYLLQKYIAN